MTKTFGDDDTYLNHFCQKNPVTFFGFSNLDVMLDYVESVPVNRNAAKTIWVGDRTFTATESMTEALKLARHGWSKGVERAQEILQKISTDHAIGRKQQHSLSGGQVNVGRMLSGNPKHMRQKTKAPSRRVVTLFVENSMLANIKTENALLRAIVTSAICDLVESRGYACEIVAVSSSFYGGHTFFQSATIVKKPNERLNLNNVVFALGHPSFLRRFVFALRTSTELCKPIWRNMGYSNDVFDKSHQPGPNEFLIARLTPEIQKRIDTCHDENEKIKTMLKLIMPADLPIEFSE